MKRHLSITSYFLFFGLLVGFSAPETLLAADVALATAPLASSTSILVKPNLLLVLDNSGSMDWDHMPDDDSDGGSSVTFKYGYYGLRSSQCNQVYYDPTTTYLPPVDATGANYPDANFTAAWDDGYNPSSGSPVNLNADFKASQSLSGDTTGQAAYYYNYTGTQITSIQQNYNSTTNDFYKECNSANATTPGSAVFTKVSLVARTSTITVSSSGSTTVSGITDNGFQIMAAPAVASTDTSIVAANIVTKINACTKAISGSCSISGYLASASGNVITLFAPTAAYSASHTPIISKTGTMSVTANAFPATPTNAASPIQLQNFANWYSYYRTRLLMMKTATGRAFSSLGNGYRVGLMKISDTGTPAVQVGAFENTQRSDWYTGLYGTTTNGSTPLRRALSEAGRYYAGKLGGTDPVQYSCQQNFSILSTDGYWNTGDGYKVDGSTAVGNQDDFSPRPMYDGSIGVNTWTVTYNRDNVTKTACTSTTWKLKTQPQVGSCTVTTAGANCTPAWSNKGTATTSASCSTSPSGATAAVEVDRQQNSSAGSSDSLADIAMYYYQTDLRTPTLGNCGTAVSPATEGPLCENNVFTSDNDNNLQQHMTTFTLGLGASGWMNYSSSYLKDTTGDFAAVKLGSTASASVCTWQTSGSVCNWPVPGMSGSNGLIANIDDLWHAAVNGRGAYFSATSPSSLASGLAAALNGIATSKGAAAAAATSTQNPVPGNNAAFYASYSTVYWKGNLEKREIDTNTGTFNKDASWCAEDVSAGVCDTPLVAQTVGSTTIYNCEIPNAVLCNNGVLDYSGNTTSGPKYCKIPMPRTCTGTMRSTVAATSDTRTIKTPNSGGTALIEFDAAYAAANSSNFNAAHIGTLTQWTTLTAAQKLVATGGTLPDGTTAAAGANLVKYLRGQYVYEDSTANDATPDQKLFRSRTAVLGDVLESQPTFVSKPVFNYPYPGYSDYKTAQASRVGTVFVGANDGMMHAFAENNGSERWAYVPSMVIPNMWKLADINYANLHVNFINGSTVSSDICADQCTNANYATTVTTSDDPVWKTILVGGLNAGGRGYYALDITNPTSPALLWEFTTTSGIGHTKDADLGYSYGNPIITKKADGTWVVIVTSGYNNNVTGDGIGYLYVLNANTGAIISKISTGVGTTATPSGLAKISGFNTEPAGNSVGYVYGGDLQGNLWRFDINDTVTTATIGKGSVLKLAKLYSDSSVTTDSSIATTKDQPITTSPVLAKIGGKRVVFIGTGKYLETDDLSTTQVQSQYAIKDDDATSTLINPRNTLVQQTLSNNPDGTATRVVTSASVNFYTGRGWFIDLNVTGESGERVNIDADLVQGVLIFPTIVPSNTACSPGGHGWLNFVDYKTGGALDTSGVASYKYDSPIVGGNLLYIDGEPVYPLITADGELHKPPPIPFPTSAGNFAGKRTLWRELSQ